MEWNWPKIEKYGTIQTLTDRLISTDCSHVTYTNTKYTITSQMNEHTQKHWKHRHNAYRIWIHRIFTKSSIRSRVQHLDHLAVATWSLYCTDIRSTGNRGGKLCCARNTSRCTWVHVCVALWALLRRVVRVGISVSQ